MTSIQTQLINKLSFLQLSFLQAFFLQVFFLQLCLVATTASGIASPTSISTTSATLTNVGFSDRITSHSYALSEIFEITKVATNIDSKEQLLKHLESRWGGHLNTDDSFSSNERLKLDKLIHSIGLHESFREGKDFIDYDSPNSLMIYIGAHPHVLCSFLTDVKDISLHANHILISASSQKYARTDFENCSELTYLSVKTLSTLQSTSPLYKIMQAYLQVFSIDPHKIEFIPNLSTEINNSARLRHHLTNHPTLLNQYDKVIIVAPQPLGEEASLTVKYYLRSEARVYRQFMRPIVNIHDDLTDLKSLLEADLDIQSKRRAEQ